MSKIRLNFKSLPVGEKIAKARQIVTALTGNAKFSVTNPALESVTAGINALDAAFAATQTARQEVKARFSDQAVKEDALDQLILQLAGHVESVAGTSDNLIHSAGFDTRTNRSPTQMPTAPLALRGTVGEHAGEIVLSWEKVAQARSYLIEKSPDPPTENSWVHAGAATRGQATINGLVSGTRYWFRVAAVGTAGQSGWSDPAVRIAP